MLLSDGNENVAAAADTAFVARSLGAEIFSLPLGRLPGEPEVRVDNLLVPSQVKAGAPYHVEAVVFSTFETACILRTVSRRRLCRASRSDVTAWQESLQVSPASTAEEGTHLYQLIVNSPQDTIPDNNRWQAFVGGDWTRRKFCCCTILLEIPALLLEALQQQGLVVRALPWNELPHTLSGYLEYDALIFDNVPGFGISVSQMEVLERYVRDMGGGLLMLGGEKSFGAGGYYRTPLEKLLPVDMDVPTKMSIPSLCLVMVIDRSDSMGGSLSETRSSAPWKSARPSWRWQRLRRFLP